MRKFLLVFILGFMSFSCYIKAQELKAQELKAFPTAEGFGKLATGGRGGAVVTVTNLEDDSLGTIAGSFRWAMTQYPSDFTVVFAVSGEIRLVRDFRPKRNNFTIAGQTAPGEGICFSGAALNFGGCNNFIVRHIRSRVGYLDVSGEIIEDNAFIANNASNFILDHCTFGWSVEENVNTYDTQFQTIQWCILHEGLYDSGHKKGARSYATQWGGSRSTYHHNLLAHHNSRSPRFNGALNPNDIQVFIEFINNVNYNWRSSGACYGAENTGGKYSIHELNMINNYYKPGPATSSQLYFIAPSHARSGMVSNGPSQFYIGGNVMEGSNEITADNWIGVNAGGSGYTKEELRVDTIIVPDDSARLQKFWVYYDKYTYNEYEEADEAFKSVTAANTGAGAWPHDEIDRRILEETREGKAEFGDKGIIDHPEDAEGYIQYAEAVALIDTDGDGIPDEWEIANNLDPNNPEDGNYVNSIGYTALEAYLNELVGESVGDYNFAFNNINVNEIADFSLTLINTIVDEELLLQDNSDLTGGSIYNMNGVRMMNVDLTNLSPIQVAHLSKGNYILVATTQDGKMRFARFIKK